MNYTYKCVHNTCRERGKEFTSALSPKDARISLGGPVRCMQCFEPVRLVRIEDVKP